VDTANCLSPLQQQNKTEQAPERISHISAARGRGGAEIRNPKPETRRKSESRNPKVKRET